MRPVLLALAVALVAAADADRARHAPAVERVRPNDNRDAAGRLHGGVLALRLEARPAEWHPDGDSAAGVVVPAFAEEGGVARVPGPLVRVSAGTVVEVHLRSRLVADTLVVHGLHARPGHDAPIVLLPDSARTVRFRLDAPGTYYYYGTTTGRAVDWRTREDAQLTGAIVVDPAGAPARRDDRIFVIGMWTDTVARAFTRRERVLAVVNGRSWPRTERLEYAVGDTARWRVINASGDAHPMHLHGFYFRVDARGDGEGDTTYAAGDRDLVVTEGMVPGGTMRLAWVPGRAGNWLFHCHIPEHFAHRGPLGVRPAAMPHDMKDATAHATQHATDAMGGLVLGIHVRPRGTARRVMPVARTGEPAPRHIRLLVRPNAGGSDSTPYFGFALQDGDREPPADSGLRVGPPLVLERGQPVRVTVVNRLAEPTAVHWHGIELESYFDGVAGFSGDGARVTPMIAPRDSFEVRFTPPRAGTFIYHTHVDEERQQPAGLAGPIIVLEPGARLDTATDHAFLVTSPWSFDEQRRSVLVNGSAAPPALVLRAGTRHRLRFVNMTLRRAAMRVELRSGDTLLAWRNLAKDGADLPAARRVVVPARHGLALGETFDVELAPDAPGEQQLLLRVGGRQQNGPVLAIVPVRVLP